MSKCDEVCLSQEVTYVFTDEAEEFTINTYLLSIEKSHADNFRPIESPYYT